MRKIWSLIVVVAVMLAMVIIPATASAISPDGAVILDNKDSSTWERIDDGTIGALSFYSTGSTFVFGFTATGLATEMPYSLIYYANPWPGNNPGKLIWSGVSDQSGVIDYSGSVDLGMNLPTPPDSNMVVDHSGSPDYYVHPFGAKIWLVPSADYDANTNSMIAWHPENYLFETDLINYIDTNVSDEHSGSVSLSATITEPAADIGVTVVSPSSIAFGEVELYDCVAGTPVVLQNTGNVPIKITALPSTGFFTDCLRLDGTPVGSWISDKVNPGDTITVATSVCVYTTTYAGSQTGSMVFVAQYAQ
jgi:hypothetical protein